MSTSIVTTVSHRVVTIALPPFPGGKEAYSQAVKSVFAGNDDILRTFQPPYFNSMVDKPMRLRVVTPAELGCESDSDYASAVNGLAQKNGLDSCDESAPVRLALLFNEIRRQLPSKYLTEDWWVHMSSIECPAGDKFISGMGTPKAIYEIKPWLSKANPLQVGWVYGGRREGFAKKQPMLFALK